jgi:hypothetical protein
MMKLRKRENGGCVDYAMVVARMALGYYGEMPLILTDTPTENEIAYFVKEVFPGHEVKVWSQKHLVHSVVDTEVYAGTTMTMREYPAEEWLFMYGYKMSNGYHHFVIGTPTKDGIDMTILVGVRMTDV